MTLPKKNKPKRGFTLIELLVTMTIIAILSVIAYSTYHSIAVKSRDQKRKDDLHRIASALEIYYSRYGRYPCTKGDSTGAPTSPQTSDPGQQNSNPQYLPVITNYPDQPFWLKDTGCQGALPQNDPTVIPKERPFNQSEISSMPIDPYLNARYNALGPPPENLPYMYIYNPLSYGYVYWSPFCHGVTNTNADNCYSVPTGTEPGVSYILWAKLENVNDTDSCKNKHYKTCNGVDECPAGDPREKLFEIRMCPI